MRRLSSLLRRSPMRAGRSCHETSGTWWEEPWWIRSISTFSDTTTRPLAPVAAPVASAAPSDGSKPRRKRRKQGRSAWGPEHSLPSLLDEAPSHDILDDFEIEDRFDGEDMESEGAFLEGADPKKPGSLAKKMIKCARIGVRAEEVWARFAQRVLMTSAFAGATDVAVMFIAFARIKYRDVKALDTLSPFILRHIDDFSVMELVLLLNAHKKLEYERLDSLQLLINALMLRSSEWTGRHVSLMTNAVAYFYIYQPRFWKLVKHALPNLIWTMNPLELSNIVSAMARVDRREPQSLLLLARMCRRCAQRNLFAQESLATSMNAFAKLDFNHPRLMRAFTEAAVVKIDRALALGRDYRCSSLRDVDVFDVQALVQLLHTLVCLVGAPDDVILKLLTLVSWSSGELGKYQRRVLKLVIPCVKAQHQLWENVPKDVKDALYVVEHTPVKVQNRQSRWAKEVEIVLKKMDIIAELKPVVDDQVIDILLPTSKAVIYTVGPYGYYASTTDRTAYSKLHQRLLEMAGYTCMVMPYYEWSELRTEEDKMVYLWSLGRRAAAQKDEPAEEEADPEMFSDEEELQSDLGNLEDDPLEDVAVEHYTKKKAKP